jgi:uncharacterized membrane protein
MAGAEPSQPSSGRTGTTRFEAFSDGVFAIAITLLVLEISVPPGSGGDLLRAVLDQWPSYLAYVVSFATVGAIWLGHNAVTEHLDQANSLLIRINLLLLMVVSFIPFPTRLLAEYITEDAPERVAVTIYGLTLLAASSVLAVLWRYGVAAQLVHPDLADDEVATLTKRLTPGLLGYLVMLGIGLLLPVVAVIGYLAIAAFFIVPVGSLARHHRAAGPAG